MSESAWWSHRSVERDLAGNFKSLRAWLHRRTGGEANVEMAIGTENRGVGLHIDGGDQKVGGHVAVGGLWLSFSTERLAPELLYRLLGVHYERAEPFDYERFKACDRAIDISMHNGSLWWTLWMNRDEWRSSDPKWRRGHFDPRDFFLGKSEVTKRHDRTDKVEIPLPEGVRPATIEWTVYTAKRTRWPWARSWRSATVTPEKPVGVPGKGENAYDCGDDAIYSQSTDARDNEHAIARFVESALRTRRRYGGSHRFTPSAAAE